VALCRVETQISASGSKGFFVHNIMPCIEISNLSHQFSGECKVVDSVSLKVPSGSIYGFLGKNGAGKTTTLRLLLVLLTRQTGEIMIFDQDIGRQRIEILRRVGSLIESPGFYAHLSAKDNLRVLQKIHQCPKNRMDTVLEIVGLQHSGSKRVRQFSLGMKQRLSIAIALLHDPELLILDEPTNGLDPNGIIEMRELLIGLNQEFGTTILISSHLLSEIERLITDLAIIDQGRVIFEGPFSDLREKQASESKIVIKAGDCQAAARTAKAMGLPLTHVNEETLELARIPLDSIASLNKALVQQNIDVFAISHERATLEELFINLLNK